MYSQFCCYIQKNEEKHRITMHINWEGYCEYKSCGMVCTGCPYLTQCTLSKDHVKVVTCHVWESYMEIYEDICQTLRMKDLYSLRKETMERIFETAKENPRFRYMQLFWENWMEMKVVYKRVV